MKRIITKDEKRNKTISLKLLKKEFDNFQQACDERNHTKSNVIRYYIEKYIQEWKENKKKEK